MARHVSGMSPEQRAGEISRWTEAQKALVKEKFDGRRQADTAFFDSARRQIGDAAALGRDTATAMGAEDSAMVGRGERINQFAEAHPRLDRWGLNPHTFTGPRTLQREMRDYAETRNRGVTEARDAYDAGKDERAALDRRARELETQWQGRWGKSASLRLDPQTLVPWDEKEESLLPFLNKDATAARRKYREEEDQDDEEGEEEETLLSRYLLPASLIGGTALAGGGAYGLKRYLDSRAAAEREQDLGWGTVFPSLAFALQRAVNPTGTYDIPGGIPFKAAFDDIFRRDEAERREVLEKVWDSVGEGRLGPQLFNYTTTGAIAGGPIGGTVRTGLEAVSAPRLAKHLQTFSDKAHGRIKNMPGALRFFVPFKNAVDPVFQKVMATGKFKEDKIPALKSVWKRNIGKGAGKGAVAGAILGLFNRSYLAGTDKSDKAFLTDFQSKHPVLARMGPFALPGQAIAKRVGQSAVERMQDGIT